MFRPAIGQPTAECGEADCDRLQIRLNACLHLENVSQIEGHGLVGRILASRSGGP
jgi:hypothetical protein